MPHDRILRGELNKQHLSTVSKFYPIKYRKVIHFEHIHSMSMATFSFDLVSISESTSNHPAFILSFQHKCVMCLKLAIY